GVRLPLPGQQPAPEQLSGPAKGGPRLEDYVQRYPEVGRVDQLSPELIAQEYEVRQCWGDRPSHREILERFPRGGILLEQTLARIDTKLAAEFERRPGSLDRLPTGRSEPLPGLPAKPAAIMITAASLFQTLQQQELLKPAQLDHLKNALPVSSAEPRALAKDLLQRGWLTAYQVNQLLQGRGLGLVVGPYLILERLGEGAAGKFSKPRHQKMGRVTALKVTRKELLTDPEVVGRFYREIQVLSQLDHPNIVHAYDAGPAGDTHFLAMEFVEGT